MSEKSEQININVTIDEIYEILCPKCKKKLVGLLKQKLPDEVIEKLVIKKQNLK